MCEVILPLLSNEQLFYHVNKIVFPWGRLQKYAVICYAFRYKVTIIPLCDQ